jgi:hypothetical protein
VLTSAISGAIGADTSAIAAETGAAGDSVSVNAASGNKLAVSPDAEAAGASLYVTSIPAQPGSIKTASASTNKKMNRLMISLSLSVDDTTLSSDNIR